MFQNGGRVCQQSVMETLFSHDNASGHEVRGHVTIFDFWVKMVTYGKRRNSVCK